MKKKQCSETSEYKIQSPWHHAKERIEQEELHYKMTESKETILQYMYTAVSMCVPYAKRQTLYIPDQKRPV